jgi:hypothetical protein
VPEKAFHWRRPIAADDRRFRGRVEGDSIIGYRNSFPPVVEGIVSGETRGSRIAVTIRLFATVLVCIAIWAWFSGAMLITGMWPAALAMLPLLYVLSMGAFWLEAGKQERTLRAIFQARD